VPAELLAFWMIFCYSFRIFTLSVLPFSSVFDRYTFDADDSNYALLYITVAVAIRRRANFRGD